MAILIRLAISLYFLVMLGTIEMPNIPITYCHTFKVKLNLFPPKDLLLINHLNLKLSVFIL